MKTIPLSIWQDVLGRSLTALAALGALFAFISGFSSAHMVSPDRLWVELWRLVGFLLFAAIFVLLTLRPRRSAGLWELGFFHKASMAVISLFIPTAAEASMAGMIDGILAMMLLAAYFLTRGWRSWRSPEVGK
jgi:hypothetical protein